MAERELGILIRARDMASKTIGTVKKEIGSLGATGSKAMASFTAGIRRAGVAAGVGLVGAIALGARSLGHLERVTNATNAVLTTTKGVSGQTAASIRDTANALEQLTTADDKNIQEAENLLLTFTKIGGKTFPQATKAAVNMAIAMAKGDVANADFKGSAIQVGKALNDPIKGITALRKAGVSFTDQQVKQITALVKSGDTLGAQKIILGELETEFGKAGEAAGTGFEADLRRVQDAGEDATQALARGFMPVLARAAQWLSKKLADPAVLKAIDELGQSLAAAATGALDFLEGVDWKSIGAGLSIAKDAAGTIVSMFMGLPDWVKTAIVTGWGLNKLTGGALSGVISGLAGGLIKGVLGMNAGVVNINAAVVNGGGLPGGAAAAGGGSLLMAALPWAVIGASIAAPIIAGLKISADNSAIAGGVRATADVYLQQSPSVADLQHSLAAVDQGINDIQANPLNVLVSGDALEQLRATRAAILTTLNNTVTGTTGAINRMNDSLTPKEAQQVAATAALRDKIESSRIAQVSAISHAGVVAREGGALAAAAIRAKELRVTNRIVVNTAITLRETIRTRQTYLRVGNIRTGSIAS